MKKIKLLIIVFVCLFIVNVKADMGPPVVVKHEVMVTNKNGAACYDDNGKKTGKVLPYGKTYEVHDDIKGSYLIIYLDSDSCTVKYSDISAKTQSFSLNNEDVIKLDSPGKAVILAKGGLNMRKGPAVTYGKITTVPEKAIVKITHKAGDYWYYAEYNGNKGWITGMDGYFGYEGKEVLINPEAVKIYSTYDQKSVLGTIPANTEITNYLKLVTRSIFDKSQYYVIYNGIKGYIGDMYYKINSPGKIKGIKEYIEYEISVLKENQEWEYNMMIGECFYSSAKKQEKCVPSEYYTYVNKQTPIIKTSGYVGEGLFGETKLVKEEITDPTKEEEKEDITPVIEPEEKKGITDVIIIALLGGIFLALTALVIIKLVNSKKKIVVKEIPKEESVKREEITVSDKEIAEARAMIAKELEKEQEERKEV